MEDGIELIKVYNKTKKETLILVIIAFIYKKLTIVLKRVILHKS